MEGTIRMKGLFKSAVAIGAGLTVGGNMKKLINHIRRWNIWRKHCLNSNFHKILVLFGVIKSPTMNTMLLPEEIPNL